MPDADEVIIIAADYWASHVADLVGLLGFTSAGTISDPLGRPPDPDQMATVTSPADWVDHPEALAEALTSADGSSPAPGKRDRWLQSSGVAGPVSDRLVLTVEEAAGLLGISRAFAYEAVNRGEIPSIRIGRRILVPKAALERLLSSGDKPDGPTTAG